MATVNGREAHPKNMMTLQMTESWCNRKYLVIFPLYIMYYIFEI